jgi:hypothetical protein
MYDNASPSMPSNKPAHCNRMTQFDIIGLTPKWIARQATGELNSSLTWKRLVATRSDPESAGVVDRLAVIV